MKERYDNRNYHGVGPQTAPGNMFETYKQRRFTTMNLVRNSDGIELIIPRKAKCGAAEGFPKK